MRISAFVIAAAAAVCLSKPCHAPEPAGTGVRVDGYGPHALRFYGCRHASVENCVIEGNSGNIVHREPNLYESMQLGRAGEGDPPSVH